MMDDPEDKEVLEGAERGLAGCKRGAAVALQARCWPARYNSRGAIFAGEVVQAGPGGDDVVATTLAAVRGADTAIGAALEEMLAEPTAPHVDAATAELGFTGEHHQRTSAPALHSNRVHPPSVRLRLVTMLGLCPGPATREVGSCFRPRALSKAQL